MSTRTVMGPGGLSINGVPEGVSDEEALARAMGGLDAENEANPAPDGNAPPDAFTQWAQDLGPAQAAQLRSREFIVNRIPESLRPEFMRPLPPGASQALADEFPIAAGIGDMGLPLASAIAAGPSILAQAGLAAGFEALRPGSTVKSTLTDAGLAAGGQAAGNMLTRVFSGANRIRQARKGVGGVLTTTSKPLRTVGEIGLSKGAVNNANQKLLTKQVGKVLGIDDLSKVTDDALTEGAGNIGKLYDDALAITKPVDTTAAFVALDDIPAAQFPGKARIMSQLENVDSPVKLRDLHRALRDKSSTMSRSQLGAFADEVDEAIKLLDVAAEEAGANPAALRLAGQRWKVLKTLDELPGAWQQGVIDAKPLLNRLGRENAKGFGTAIKRTPGATDRLIPEVRTLTDSLKTLVSDPALQSSGTAERLLTGGGALTGATGLLSGAIDPVTAGLGLAAYGIVPPLSAAASVGKAVAPVGNVLGLAARELNPDPGE